jgi:hypothetical protein
MYVCMYVQHIRIDECISGDSRKRIRVEYVRYRLILKSENARHQYLEYQVRHKVNNMID